MKKTLEVITAFVLSITINGFFSPLAIAELERCDDYGIIWVNGSGAKIDGSDNNFNDFKTAVIVEMTSGTWLPVKYSFYELGTEEHGGYKYPAVGIGTESFENIATSLGAFVSGGNSYTYGDSIKAGVGELKSYIGEELTKCPNERFVIGGLSQGAEVISTALPELEIYQDKITYIATFGDPKLYLPEGMGHLLSSACHNGELSEYREYVPDCWAYEGILGKNDTYTNNSFYQKLGVFCNHNDVVCTSRMNFLNMSESLDPHGSYGDSYNHNHIYEMAAKIIREKIFREKHRIIDIDELYAEEVAIAIDVSVSIYSDWNTVNKKLRMVTDELFDRGTEISLYQFRDLNDPYEPNKVCGRNPIKGGEEKLCTRELIYDFKDSAALAGGNDIPESILSAADLALDDTAWTENKSRSLILISDAGYHKEEDYRGKHITTESIIEKSADKGVKIFPIILPRSIYEADFDLLANGTGGNVYYYTGEKTEISFKNIIGTGGEKPIGILPKIINAIMEIVDGNMINIKFGKQNVYRTVLVVNDTILGNTDETEINITDLDFSRDNKITLIPYDDEGHKGESVIINISASIDKTEGNDGGSKDDGDSKNDEDNEEGGKNILPKTPDCGIVKNDL